ncbi:hypothetical protein C5167_043465 [Papaver somniferum]|uniref:Uncharacterized protein n=1 Tax=Papaver somniferum TaxID=3469 RepID=A0A4Y7L8F1_PAPSO|nr:hypothetical protein C5167_043465 [Papaver somniferum]
MAVDKGLLGILFPTMLKTIKTCSKQAPTIGNRLLNDTEYVDIGVHVFSCVPGGTLKECMNMELHLDDLTTHELQLDDTYETYEILGHAASAFI